MVRGRTTQSPRNSTPWGNLLVIPTGAKRSGGISRSRQSRFLDSLRSLEMTSSLVAPRSHHWIQVPGGDPSWSEEGGFQESLRRESAQVELEMTS
jgi:hypothetical protein